MGNKTTKEIGDFQQNVGKASSDINLVGSIVFGSIFGIIGLGLCIGAFIPYQENINCSGNDSDSACSFNKDIVCSVDKRDCYIKKRPYFLIIPGIFMIGISILIIYMSYFWKKEVYSNRSLAEVGGTMTEIDMAKNLFSN
jgi:hypothetical protein